MAGSGCGFGAADPVPATASRAPACLLTTCGLPGAGKSTLVRALAAFLAEDGPGASLGVRVSHVCFDDIERRLLATSTSTSASTDPPAFDPATWRAARAEAFAELARLLATRSDDARPHHLVVADDTFHYAGMRYQCRQLARRHAAAHVQLYLSSDPDAASRRNEARATPVPRDAFVRMADQMEPPDPAKRAFERRGLVVLTERERGLAHDPAAETKTSSFEGGSKALEAAARLAWDRVARAWGGAEAAPEGADATAARREEGQAANAASAAHALDLRTRKVMGVAMRAIAERAGDSRSQGGEAATRAKAASARLGEARRATLDAARRAARAAEAATEAAEEGEGGGGAGGGESGGVAAAFFAEVTALEAAFGKACAEAVAAARGEGAGGER